MKQSNVITMVLRGFAVASVIAASFGALLAQKYTGSPVTKDRLVRTIRSKQFAVPTIVKQIKLSGVDFE